MVFVYATLRNRLTDLNEILSICIVCVFFLKYGNFYLDKSNHQYFGKKQQTGLLNAF